MTLKLYGLSTHINSFTNPSTIGEFYRSVSKIFNENKIDIRLIMPKYGSISDRKFILREVIRLKEIPIEVGEETLIPSVKSAFIPDTKVQTYFVVYPDFCKKFTANFDINFEAQGYDQFEDCMLLYNLSGVLTLKHLYWKPDIIFTNNWYSALVPIVLGNQLKDHEWYQNSKSVLLLNSSMNFSAYSKEKLSLFHLNDPDYDLSDPNEYLQAAIKHSAAVVFFEESGENKLADRLAIPETKKLLDEKGELFKTVSIEDENDEESWGQLAKDYYEFLETV